MRHVVLRIMEAMLLCVSDVDFARCEIVVRNGKGAKDRVTTVPRTSRHALLAHLRDVRAIHDRDLLAGGGSVLLPNALARKFRMRPENGAGNTYFRRC